MDKSNLANATEHLIPQPLTGAVDWSNELIVRAIMSAVMIAILWTVRVVLCRMVRRKADILSPDQRRWTHMVQNLIWVLIVLGMIMIWTPQLRTAALSLTAFVVAIVIATKEVILCFMGAFMRVSTAPFRMGDWITIDGISGEVFDINPFAVKMQELDTTHGTYRFTGKIVQIPNSRYFTAPIENISFLKHYKSHHFMIGVQEPHLNGQELAAALRDIVSKHTAPIHEEAAQTSRRISRNSGIPMPDPAPLVTFTQHDFNNMHFMVCAFLPTRKAATISAAIHEDFNALITQKREAFRADERRLDAEAKAAAEQPPARN